MEFFSRRQLLSPLLLVLVYFTYLAYARSHHIRHHRDRFKRQQGAHLYLPGSYVTDGDDEPDAGPWLEWSSPSQCSRTCGGGVSTQYRQCTPGYRCTGPTRRHFSCNTQDCPDLADFRAIQCAEFNNSPFEGTLYEWVPYTKSPQPCELNCMPRGERFYYRHKLQVVDGTKCNDESVDVCVQGKCQPVGCDMMLGSDAREDQCRVCEGDGSTCNTMNGLLDMQDLQVGYNDILLIPAGAVNINVREANRSNNYLAIRNATGHYYLNGNWRIDFPRTLEFAGSKFHYERSPQGFSAPDTITSIGPIEESLFIVLLYQDTNVGIHYEYSIPKSVQHPTYIETYAWTFDQFTPCSSSCGGGYQSRNVSCAGRKSLDPVNSTLCDANNKPVETQRCGEIPCEPKWVTKQWEKCSATCGDGGTQTRKIYCEQIISGGVPSIVDEGQCANVPKPSTQQACNQGVVCGEWHAGPWKPCNRLCGKGKETRDITCYRKVDGKITVLDGKECTNSQKPEASRSCVLRPCEGVDWVASEWSGCQNKCGLTEETRAVQCMTASGETFPDALCAEDEEKPETTRKCVTRGCEYEWYASQWSECSAKCGSGIQTRKVFCTKPIDEGFTKVDESNCDSSKKYDGSRNCSAEATECPGEWFSGPWTKCTKVCGGGEKTRKVLCIKGNTTAHVKECDPDLIPSGSEGCNKAACDKDEVIPVSTTKLVATTTEIPTELEEEDDEYEIVEDDECEDGEWVDVDGIPQRKLSPSEKLSLVSKSLGESTDTDLQTQADNPFAEDELMLGDFPGDADSLNAAAVTDASGDYSTYSPLPSGFSFEGSGDTIEASGDGTGLTEVTESFSASRMYTLGSSLGTFETFGVTDEPDTFTEIDVIRTSDGVESTEMRSTDITTEEPISKETVAEISLASFEYSTSDADTETTEDTIETSEGTTEQPETSATEITTEVSGITDEVATKVSESTEDTSTKASESTEEETATKASESTEETATKASESTEEETATKASESTEDETATKASESTEETATKASESTEETATESTEAETATKASESTEEETATKVSESTEETATKVSEPTEETATKVSESTEEIATKVSESTEETVTKVTGVSEEDATDASKITSEVPEVTVTKAEADVTDVTSEAVPVSSERIYTEATDITSGLPDVTTEESDDVSSKEPPSVTEETDITDVSSKEPKLVASEEPTTEGVEATTEKAATDITQVTTEEPITSTKEPSTDTTEEGITSESAVGLSSVIVETTSKEEIATEKEVTATTTEEVSEISSKVPAVTEVTQIPTTTGSGVGITEIEETTIKGAASTDEEITKVPAETGTTEKIEVTTETEKVEVTEEEIVTTEKEIASTTEPESVAETTTESLITTTVASVISSVTSMFTKFISLGEELTTDMTDITEEGTTQETITEAEKVTGTTEEPEEITNKTTEFDIWSSTESTVTSKARTTLIEIFTTRKIRWCKRVKKPACKRSEFGCCPDKITPAKGPFDKGCPIPTTCKETKYGCCEDGVSPASGVDLKGCPTSQCDQTLFGCCPDTVTPSQGNNNEGCPPPPPECAKSIFGCCEDNATEAQGPNSEGCKEKEEYTTEEEEIPTTTFEYTTTEPEDCKRSAYGCCPDGVSVAQGESFKGCDLIHPTDCNKSYYNCCPDGVTSAEGPNFQGCKIECLKSAFGCCDDGITPAHGYNKEGCCLNTQFGCCPDNIQPAHGPKEEGCGCAYSKFGCCPDNVTAATGRNIDGCGCQYAQFGCCPDNHAVATGADYEGCACHTFQFGCCPDGVTVARGLRNEGCGCVHSEFGCCSDKKTAANGPNFAGCDCVSSIYGCCPDGNTEAQGENFEGCIDAPEDLQEHCQLAKDRGTCRNYTVRWFYDMEYGGCSRFWYGGCDGNGNRFKSKEDCNNICVEPVGKDRCNLPKVSGPCEGYYPQWYYDKTRNLCTQFIYGGCLGNNNRFETRDECNELCVTDSVSDPCELPQEAGPCHGDYINWYYNKESGYCEQFIYGGCKGNSNNFLTEAACKQKCAPASEKKPSCSLPKVQGECTELLPRWYYDSTEERCMPFYFTGCSGNSNNFASQYHCELDCPKQHVRETCQLPADSGECSNYVGRFYYDTKEKSCKHFYYGGCGGNKNNFDSEDICMARCKDGNISEPETITTPSPAPELPLTTQGPEPFKIEFCYLPPEAGPCRKAEARWYYDNDATCKQFAYGGCGGNRNNFLSSDECAKMCGDAEDICHLPMVPGPCHADYVAWYYNQTSATCEMFKYGGCMGNGNKFNDLESCEKRCKKIVSTTAAAVVEPTHDPTDPTRVCLRSVDHGTCNETIPAFFYDPNISKCAPFTYTGCGGNDNRFTSPESCERFCGTYRGHDPCSLPSDVGPCRAALRKFYFDMETATCQEFTYGGCFGNANRFSTIEECNSVCGSRQPAPQPVLTTVSPAAQPGPEAEPPQPAADCTQYQEECSNLRCQYGMKGYVENLCNRCKCVDPCEEVTCSSGTRCGVEPNRNQNDSSDTSPFVGVCREINKPGDCPIIRGSGDDCREECRDDADCPIDLLCCSNGCGYVCLMPAVTTFAPPSELRTTSFPVYTHRPLTSDTFAPEVIEDEFNPIVTAGEGDYATLKCAIRGNPRPRFTWSKENVLIDGKEPRYRILLEGAALQIISLYKTDAGIYLCSADNNIGKPLRKEIRLEVIDPVQHPTRVIDDPELSNVVVSLGSPAMLNCYAYGYPPPVVMWWKDNEFIPFKSNEYTISKDHTLLINGVKLHNLGLYTCQAYNGIGKATSWSVTVQTIGPVYSTNDEDRKYMKYVIDRQKGPTTPRPEHPQTPLIPKSTPLAITSSTVISTTPTPTTTLVPTAPRIYTVPVRANITLSNTNYPVGSSIHIHCDVEGFPIPTVQWYKDSQPLSPSQTLQITGSHRLIINNATEADSGEYRCAAWNQYSNATSTIPLYIQGRFIHPSCKDNPFFANCPLIIKANFCSHKYYARFCCRSCTEAGKLPSVGPHLRTDIVQNDQNDLA